MRQETVQYDPDSEARAIALPATASVPTSEWISLIVLIMALLASPFLFDLSLQLGLAQ